MTRSVSDLFLSIDAYCEHFGLLTPGSHVVLGLSGGPDSMFLLYYLVEKHHAGLIHLRAAHLDHEWRSDSGEDAHFCLRETAKLGIELTTGRASQLGVVRPFNGSKEEVGRHLRRSFLENICLREKAHCIALAHQLQDQQETFLMRLIRGCSLTGLAAMRPRQGSFIRPLLTTKRDDIIAYLHAHAIAYLNDPTNDDEAFLRNRLRARVIPALRAADERFDSNFVRSLEQVRRADDLITSVAASVMDRICVPHDTSTTANALRIAELLVLDDVLQKRILMRWLCQAGLPFAPSTGFLSEILGFLRQPHGTLHTLGTSWAVAKHKGTAWIVKKDAQ